jgi:hypothetical protein
MPIARRLQSPSRQIGPLPKSACIACGFGATHSGRIGREKPECARPFQQRALNGRETPKGRIVMHAKSAILILMCLLAGACASGTDVTEKPMLDERYVVYGEYRYVLASIDDKVEQCVLPPPPKGFALQKHPDMLEMYFFSNSAWDELAPMLQDPLECCQGLPEEEVYARARFVLRVKAFDKERTQVDVYAAELSKLAWPVLRNAIQYGAEDKIGCPDSPQPDLAN